MALRHRKKRDAARANASISNNLFNELIDGDAVKLATGGRLVNFNAISASTSGSESHSVSADVFGYPLGCDSGKWSRVLITRHSGQVKTFVDHKLFSVNGTPVSVIEEANAIDESMGPAIKRERGGL